MSKKTLTILRHAKAETGSSSQDDKARALARRGREATAIVGAYLVQHHVMPELVLCSDAVRTTETWFGIEHVYGRPLPVKYLDKLYLASANEMLDVIAGVSEDVQQLMLVAHNPGVHELAMRLAKDGEEKLIDRMAIKFPTCAVARFACHAPDWPTLAQGRTELIDFVSPKMLGQVIVG